MKHYSNLPLHSWENVTNTVTPYAYWNEYDILFPVSDQFNVKCEAGWGRKGISDAAVTENCASYKNRILLIFLTVAILLMNLFLQNIFAFILFSKLKLKSYHKYHYHDF